MEFVQQVESVFGFLREKGFSVPASEIEDLFVRFQGTNVHIDLAYDFKDRVTDCTIGLVENGSPTAAWGKGLYAYLLEHKQFDQGLPDADPQYDEVTGRLMVYRELLLEHASELLNDDPTELRNYYD